MNPLLLTLAGLVCASALGGCANPSHLVFHQSGSLGVDAALNTDTGQVHVALGYDRQTNALIPKTRTQTENGEVENEAMSAISTSQIRIKWLGLHEVTEQFATGKAAVNLAERPESAAQVLTLTEPNKKVDEEGAR